MVGGVQDCSEERLEMVDTHSWGARMGSALCFSPADSPACYIQGQVPLGQVGCRGKGGSQVRNRQGWRSS